MNWNKISNILVHAGGLFLFVGFIFSVSYMASTSIQHTVNYGDHYDQMCQENFGQSWEYDGVSTYPFKDKIAINCYKDNGAFSPPRDHIELSKTEWERTVNPA